MGAIKNLLSNIKNNSFSSSVGVMAGGMLGLGISAIAAANTASVGIVASYIAGGAAFTIAGAGSLLVSSFISKEVQNNGSSLTIDFKKASAVGGVSMALLTPLVLADYIDEEEVNSVKEQGSYYDGKTKCEKLADLYLLLNKDIYPDQDKEPEVKSYGDNSGSCILMATPVLENKGEDNIMLNKLSCEYFAVNVNTISGVIKKHIPNINTQFATAITDDKGNCNIYIGNGLSV